MNDKIFNFKRLLPQDFERIIRAVRDHYLRKYKIEKLPQEIYSDQLKKYSISFCITCMNRLFHLKETLKKNIADNKSYGDIEFVVINYNSKDKLDQWMRKHMMKYIESGIVSYYKTEEPESYFSSKAKNLAHTLAQGEIVCNLDGDNFTGKDFAYYINYMFNKYGENIFLHCTKKPFWGTEGRMTLTKEKFLELGGYDEELLPVGHDDHDLLNRAVAYGLTYKRVEIENFLSYLSNTEKEKAVGEIDGKPDFYKSEKINQRKSDENIRNGKLVANPYGRHEFTLYKNFSTEPLNIKDKITGIKDKMTN